MDIDKSRLLLAMFTLTGFTLLVAGGLLAYYFNSIEVTMLPLYRLVGLAASLALTFIGGHIVVVSVYSFRRIAGS